MKQKVHSLHVSLYMYRIRKNWLLPKAECEEKHSLRKLSTVCIFVRLQQVCLQQYASKVPKSIPRLCRHRKSTCVSKVFNFNAKTLSKHAPTIFINMYIGFYAWMIDNYIFSVYFIIDEHGYRNICLSLTNHGEFQRIHIYHGHILVQYGFKWYFSFCIHHPHAMWIFQYFTVA